MNDGVVDAPIETIMSNNKEACAPNAQHFNKLTPAEAELLAVLSEELGETQQIIGKILRHGYESYSPFDRKKITNRELLATEIGHIMHAMSRLFDAGHVSSQDVEGAEWDKSQQIGKYLHHQ